VLAALSTVAAVPAANPLRTLGLPDVPSRSPEFLDAVIDALVALPGPLVVVFDDLQELTHEDPIAGLATLLENRPPGLRLVLASRSDPPLRLGRLRLAGELRELRAAALAFTSDEAAAVLARADVHVTPRSTGCCSPRRRAGPRRCAWPASRCGTRPTRPRSSPISPATARPSPTTSWARSSPRCPTRSSRCCSR
jgi:hypothetical protein